MSKIEFDQSANHRIVISLVLFETDNVLCSAESAGESGINFNPFTNAFIYFELFMSLSFLEHRKRKII